MTTANAELDSGSGATKTPNRARARGKKKRAKLPVDPSRYCTHDPCKTTGKRCRAHPVLGRDTCEMHGGGGGAPATHGRASNLPARMQAAYAAAHSDKNLLSLRHGLSLLEVLVGELQRRMTDMDTPEFRAELVRLWRALTAAMAPEGERSEAGKLLKQIGDLIERGGESDEALQRLIDVVERFQKRVEEARRIGMQAQQAINARELHTAMVRYLDALAVGCQAEGIEGPVIARLLDRMQGAISGLGLELPAGVRTGIADSSRN